MEITTASTTSTTAAASATSGALAATSNISADFETFLRMLTVQMQNQDPLNPVDSSDYATQLATFSGVEQQVKTNDLLRDLSSLMGTGGLAQLAGWVGMQARAAVPVYFDGAPINIEPNVAPAADAAQMVVYDASGVEVQRYDIGLDGEPLIWAGVSAEGAPLPQGIYRFDTVSFEQGEKIATTTSEVYATVAEVQVKNGANILVMRGGGTIDASDVTAVRNADLI